MSQKSEIIKVLQKQIGASAVRIYPRIDKRHGHQHKKLFGDSPYPGARYCVLDAHTMWRGCSTALDAAGRIHDTIVKLTVGARVTHFVLAFDKPEYMGRIKDDEQNARKNRNKGLCETELGKHMKRDKRGAIASIVEKLFEIIDPIDGPETVWVDGHYAREPYNAPLRIDKVDTFTYSEPRIDESATNEMGEADHVAFFYAHYIYRINPNAQLILYSIDTDWMFYGAFYSLAFRRSNVIWMCWARTVSHYRVIYYPRLWNVFPCVQNRWYFLAMLCFGKWDYKNGIYSAPSKTITQTAIAAFVRRKKKTPVKMITDEWFEQNHRPLLTQVTFGILLRLIKFENPRARVSRENFVQHVEDAAQMFNVIRASVSGRATRDVLDSFSFHKL